jgi:hypothetical protein
MEEDAWRSDARFSSRMLSISGQVPLGSVTTNIELVGIFGNQLA